MEIDWLTTAAQLVNFLVLVWLLRRFLFGPISRAIDERRREIAGTIEEAERRERAAEAERAALAAEREALAADADGMKNAAKAEAAALATRLRAEAEREAARRREALAAATADERAALGRALEAEAGLAAIEIARAVLDELADEPLEALLVRRLARELEGREAIAPAAGAGPVDAVLTCRWPKPDADGALVPQLGEELSRILGRPVALTLEHDRSRPVGAVLEAPGFRAEWSLAAHLERVAGRFRNPAEPAVRA